MKDRIRWTNVEYALFDKFVQQAIVMHGPQSYTKIFDTAVQWMKRPRPPSVKMMGYVRRALQAHERKLRREEMKASQPADLGTTTVPTAVLPATTDPKQVLVNLIVPHLAEMPVIDLVNLLATVIKARQA